jgi:uncharacterized phiE125 gp8 family phage protein
MYRVIDTMETVVEPATAAAVTLEYARSHLRSLARDEDELVQAWIYAATQHFEAQTGRQVMTATRELWLDAFPCVPSYLCRPSALRIELPRPPLQDVVSVIYVAADGTETQLDPVGSTTYDSAVQYQVKAPSGPYARRGWIEPAYGQVWPTARSERGSIRIQYHAGYGDRQEDVPELAVGILCYLIGQFDQFRVPATEVTGRVEAMPIGLQMLMDEFKYSALPSNELRTWVSAYGYGPGGYSC